MAQQGSGLRSVQRINFVGAGLSQQPRRIRQPAAHRSGASRKESQGEGSGLPTAGKFAGKFCGKRVGRFIAAAGVPGQPPYRRAVDHLQALRRENLGYEGACGVNSGSDRGEGGYQRRPNFGQGSQLKGCFYDNAQSAQGAGIKLVQVIAGDVLDHLAAGFGFHPLGAHHADADEPVPGRSVGIAEGAVGVGGQNTAEGGPVGERRLQRHKLPSLSQFPLQCFQGNSGFHGGGQVGGLKVQHPVIPG